MGRDLTETMEEAITGSTTLRDAAQGTQKVVNGIFSLSILKPVKTFLNGTWLEHPLHPVITAVPVGAWTASIFLDMVSILSGVRRLGRASGLVSGLGTLAALGAAITGFADWVDVDPPELAVGIVHAITNITATVLFATSFVIRWRDRWKTKPASFIPAALGYLIVTVGAYIGGSLVYRQGVMINRNAHRPGVGGFTPVLGVNQLPDNTCKRVEVEGQPVLLVRQGEQIYAMGAVCSHYGGPLEEGKLVGDCVECPWHGSRFLLKDGSVQAGPATSPNPAYEVRVEHNLIEVKSRAA